MRLVASANSCKLLIWDHPHICFHLVTVVASLVSCCAWVNIVISTMFVQSSVGGRPVSLVEPQSSVKAPDDDFSKSDLQMTNNASVLITTLPCPKSQSVESHFGCYTQ